MEPIMSLSQRDYEQESGIIRKFPVVTIFYDELSRFPYVATTDNNGWIKYHTDKSKSLKTLIKRLNTEVFCIEYRKGKYLTQKTVGSNIEILNDTFKKELV